jgi:hypothetical protein
MIKPLRIEPKDIYVTFEMSVTDMEKILEYVEKLLPFSAKIVDDADVRSAANELIEVFKEILDSPLIKKG